MGYSGAIIRLNTLICKLFRMQAGKNARAGEIKPVRYGGVEPAGTSGLPLGEMAEMEDSMKRKSMIVAVLLAGMVLGACGKKNETSVVEDPVVSEAPTEEAALEPEETTDETDQSAGETEESTKENETTAAENTDASETTKSSSSGNSNTVAESSSAKAETTDSAGSESADAQSEQSTETESTQQTGVQAKYQMYAGTYFDQVIYSYAAEDNDAEVAPYCEIEVSNVTSTSFDFTIYTVDGTNRSVKFKTNTAVFTGDGTQAEFNGKGYHLVFTFPNGHEALPDVTDMQVSGLSGLDGNTYVNNTVPGHEFG